VLDFFDARAVAANYIRVEPVYELSSDHLPIIATIGAHAIHCSNPTLATHHTEWEVFGAYTTDNIDNLRIKQQSELDDTTNYFTTILQEAAWHSPQPPRTPSAPVKTTPLHICNLFAEKRRERSRFNALDRG